MNASPLFTILLQRKTKAKRGCGGSLFTFGLLYTLSLNREEKKTAMKSNENNTQALCDCPQSYLCSSVFMWPWGERGMVVRGTYAIYTSFLLFHSVSLSESFKSIMMHRMRQRHHNELHLFFAAAVYTVDATLCSCEHRPTMLHAVHECLDWRKIHYDFLKTP